MSTKGAHQPLIGTGYETLLADRVSSIFAYVAKKNGVVSTVNEHGVTITYDDGEVVFVKAGRLYGRAEGSYYLHDESYMDKLSNRHWRGLLVMNEVEDGHFDEMFLSIEYLGRKYEL